MNKICYLPIGRPGKGGMIEVFIECELFGNTIDLDTRVRVMEDEWSDSAGMVNDSNPNYIKLNLAIRKIIHETEGFELAYGPGITLYKIKEFWDCTGAGYDFVDFMQDHINVRKDIRQSTKDIHKRVLHHLKNWRSSVNVSELTEDFVVDFVDNLKGTKLSDSTLDLHVRVLRSYYKAAKKKYGDKVPPGSFDNYTKPKGLKWEYRLPDLTCDEVRLLECYAVEPKTNPTRAMDTDRFLFLSYTGLRISDFRALSELHSSGAVLCRDSSGECWLDVVSIKTGAKSEIPLSTIFDGKAIQIYTKYSDRLVEFFGVTTTCSFNSRLKTIAKEVGIKKNVTSHCGRHTFASRLVSRGTAISVIQKLLGHSRSQVTELYAKVSKPGMINNLGGRL